MFTPQTNLKWSKYSHYVTILKTTALLQERNDRGEVHLVLSCLEYSGLRSGISSLLLQKVVASPYTLPHHTRTEAGIKGFKLKQPSNKNAFVVKNSVCQKAEI